MQYSPRRILPTIGIAALFLLLAMPTLSLADSSSSSSSSSSMILCTEDAKLCPDGSYVSRNGAKNCAFNDCPTMSSTPPQPMICSHLAKPCPDGSFVTENPAKQCAFDECPVVSSSEFSVSSVSSPTLPSATWGDPVLAHIETFTNPFTDTDLSTPEGKAAAELYRRGAMNGVSAGVFDGSAYVNRAQVAKIFLLIRGYDVASNTSSTDQLSDVPLDAWYAPFIHAAIGKGILFGNPDHTFRPEKTVNRAEFLLMFARTFGLSTTNASIYTDAPIHSWYGPYANLAQQYDLFPGTGSHLLPGQPMTRNDIAVAMYNYLKNAEFRM